MPHYHLRASSLVPVPLHRLTVVPRGVASLVVWEAVAVVVRWEVVAVSYREVVWSALQEAALVDLGEVYLAAPAQAVLDVGGEVVVVNNVGQEMRVGETLPLR